MTSLALRSNTLTPDDIPEFVRSDLTSYLCPVCHGILRDCLQLPCGHKICQNCLDQLFTDSLSDGICPISDEDCFPFPRNEVVPDYGTRREILKLKVYCPYKDKGCETIIEWIKLQEHKENCQYRQRDCPFKHLGCNEVITYRDITDHVTNHCQFSEVICEHCGMAIMRKDMQEHHETTCSKMPVTCRYHCDISSLPREEMILHEESCPKKLSKCPYTSAGCTFVGKDKDIKEHEKIAVVEHLALNRKYTDTMELQNHNIQTELQVLKDQKIKMDNDIIEVRDSYRNLVQNYEGLKREYTEFQMRVVGTVEKVFGMEELLKNVPTRHTTDQLGRDLRSLKENQDEMNKKLSDMDSRRGFTPSSAQGNSDSSVEALKKQIQNLEKQTAIQDIRLAELDLRFQILETASYNGVLVWKIMDYARRKNDAINGRTYSLFSQPFYTGRFGYKMCGRVYLNGDGMGKGSHISLFFVIMKGEHDALMPWPFQQNIQMSLLDLQDGLHPVSDSFRPDTASSSFQRPTTDMNTAVGCPMFAAHAKLETRKYLKEDTIFMKIVVDTSGLPHH